MTTNLENRMARLEKVSGVNDSRSQVDEIWLVPISPSGEHTEPVLYWSRHDKTIHLGEKIWQSRELLISAMNELSILILSNGKERK